MKPATGVLAMGNWSTVRSLALAWLVTVPFPALLAITAYGVVSVVGV